MKSAGSGASQDLSRAGVSRAPSTLMSTMRTGFSDPSWDSCRSLRRPSACGQMAGQCVNPKNTSAGSPRRLEKASGLPCWSVKVKSAIRAGSGLRWMRGEAGRAAVPAAMTADVASNAIATADPALVRIQPGGGHHAEGRRAGSEPAQLRGGLAGIVVVLEDHAVPLVSDERDIAGHPVNRRRVVDPVIDDQVAVDPEPDPVVRAGLELEVAGRGGLHPAAPADRELVGVDAGSGRAVQPCEVHGFDTRQGGCPGQREVVEVLSR